VGAALVWFSRGGGKGNGEKITRRHGYLEAASNTGVCMHTEHSLLTGSTVQRRFSAGFAKESSASAAGFTLGMGSILGWVEIGMFMKAQRFERIEAEVRAVKTGRKTRQNVFGSKNWTRRSMIDARAPSPEILDTAFFSFSSAFHSPNPLANLFYYYPRYVAQLQGARLCTLLFSPCLLCTCRCFSLVHSSVGA
jgi:hypothetical protein